MEKTNIIWSLVLKWSTAPTVKKKGKLPCGIFTERKGKSVSRKDRQKYAEFEKKKLRTQNPIYILLHANEESRNQ